METIQVTEKAKRMIVRFGDSDNYQEFESVMLEAFTEIAQHLEYINYDKALTGKDLAPLFALGQYMELVGELRKGYEEQTNS